MIEKIKVGAVRRVPDVRLDPGTYPAEDDSGSVSDTAVVVKEPILVERVEIYRHDVCYGFRWVHHHYDWSTARPVPPPLPPPPTWLDKVVAWLMQSVEADRDLAGVIITRRCQNGHEIADADDTWCDACEVQNAEDSLGKMLGDGGGEDGA